MKKDENLYLIIHGLFYHVVRLLVNVTLVSIPTYMKNRRFDVFLRFVNDLQTPKQEFSIYVHKSQDLEAFNSLIWRFYIAGF